MLQNHEDACYFLKEFVMKILASTRIFRTKSKLIFLFSLYLTLLCRDETYFEFIQVSSASFVRIDEPI